MTPENFVRVRIWHSNTGPSRSKASVMTPIATGRGNVGHVTLETSHGYLSMWPTAGGSELHARTPTFVPSPEVDAKFEKGLPDEIFVFYSLNTDKIHEFLKDLMLVDVTKPYIWDPGESAIDPLSYNEPDDMVNPPRLVNTESAMSGPLQPWKLLSGGSIKFGHPAGLSCAGAVRFALEAGGIKTLFRIPYNFVRERVAHSPNNTVGLLAELKRQELMKHPETAFLTCSKGLTEMEKEKFDLSDSDQMLTRKIQRLLFEIENKKSSFVYSREMTSKDTTDSESDNSDCPARKRSHETKLEHIFKRLDAFSTKVVASVSCRKIPLEVILKDLEFVDQAFDKILSAENTKELTAAIKFLSEETKRLQKMHKKNNSLLRLACAAITNLLSYVAEKIFDFTDCVETGKATITCYSREVNKHLSQTEQIAKEALEALQSPQRSGI